MVYSGMLAGLFVSLPKGPAGFLVIYQTITKGFFEGFELALGCIGVTFVASVLILPFQISDSKKITLTKKPGFSILVGVISVALGTWIIYGSMYLLPGNSQSLLEKVKDLLTHTDGGISIFGILLIIGFLFEATFGTVLVFLKVDPEILKEKIFKKLQFFVGVILGSFLYYFFAGLFTRSIIWVGGNPQMKTINIVVGVLFIIIGFVMIIRNYKSEPVA